MEKRYLSPRELSEYTGIARGTIYNWICSRDIPFIKKSRLVKFDKEEIDRWLKRDRVQCVKEF